MGVAALWKPAQCSSWGSTVADRLWHNFVGSDGPGPVSIEQCRPEAELAFERKCKIMRRAACATGHQQKHRDRLVRRRRRRRRKPAPSKPSPPAAIHGSPRAGRWTVDMGVSRKLGLASGTRCLSRGETSALRCTAINAKGENIVQAHLESPTPWLLDNTAHLDLLLAAGRSRQRHA